MDVKSKKVVIPIDKSSDQEIANHNGTRVSGNPSRRPESDLRSKYRRKRTIQPIHRPRADPLAATNCTRGSLVQQPPRELFMSFFRSRAINATRCSQPDIPFRQATPPSQRRGSRRIYLRNIQHHHTSQRHQEPTLHARPNAIHLSDPHSSPKALRHLPTS